MNVEKEVASTTECNISFRLKKKKEYKGRLDYWAPWVIHHENHVSSMKLDGVTCLLIFCDIKIDNQNN
jgi:hypothetical protein